MYFLESLAEILLSGLQQRVYFIFLNDFKDSKELRGTSGSKNVFFLFLKGN